MNRAYPAFLLLLTWICLNPLGAQQRQVVDVQSVRMEGDPAQWVRTFEIPDNPPEFSCDVLVAGAGAGGVAAALRAAERGHSVCLTEETDKIGGQFASVPALDENHFIEFSGGTRTYYEVRHRIREYYRDRYRLAPHVAALENLNPGQCYVSPLCFEPRVGISILESILEQHKDKVRILLRTVVFDLERHGEVIRSALAYRFEPKDVIRIRPRWVLDATELGDLLPLAGVPYVVGSEARADTQEPHASEKPNPECVQSFTYTFVLEHRSGELHRIPKPPDYEEFRDGQPFSLLLNYPEDYGWAGNVQYTMFGEDPPIPNNQTPRPFFRWRRIVARQNFSGEGAPPDLALINWPRQDYEDETLLDKSPMEIARILQQAKRLSFAFLYWLQTDLAREDGMAEKGYPELKLRPDVMGSEDGLSKYPYIRESRRLRARERVVEQDIVDQYQSGSRAKWFPDSVGTAFYMVDIHPCGANERGRMMMPKPFQIPMGTLLPQEANNLLAAGKNLGVTHLTNGAYRLHPVEWNIGESAATIASLAIEKADMPSFFDVQVELVKDGIQIVWFDDLRVNHPSFAAIQLAAIRGLYPLDQEDLHASPEAPMTRGEAARSLAAYFGHDVNQPGSGRLDVPPDHPHARAIDIALEKGWMAVDHRNWFHPDIPFYWTDWRENELPGPLPPLHAKRTGPVKRAEMAERLVGEFLTQ